MQKQLLLIHSAVSEDCRLCSPELKFTFSKKNLNQCFQKGNYTLKSL